MSQAQQNTPAEKAAAARRTALGLVAVVAGMASLAFAAVPLYNYICRVTGFAGTIEQVESAPTEVTDRYITVHFSASTDPALPWSFEPVQSSVRVRIGEQNIAYYRATNLTDRPVTGFSNTNVAPFKLGDYFDKIECFCFELQTLAPHETVDMPVVFYVHPDILEDPETADVVSLTLAYTFFLREGETEDGADEIAAVAAGE